MAIKKQFLKSKPVCKVTFEVEMPEAEKISVVGDFNDWNPESTPLKKQKNGKFKGAINFDIENTHEFRYFIDGNFENEVEADGYRFNNFAGAENSLLIV